MWRLIIVYGAALAALAFLLEWLDYKHAVHAWTTEFYVACIAVVFVALGIWVGNRLTARSRLPRKWRGSKNYMRTQSAAGQ